MNFLFKTNLLARQQSTLLALEEWRMICPKCELKRKEVKERVVLVVVLVVLVLGGG